MADIKKQLLKDCDQFISDKRKITLHRIQSLQNDLLSETKSSAGDKHETGRAMLHLEMEKSAQQLEVVNEMEDTVRKVRGSKNSHIASLGSLIETNIGSYFLAISLGQLKVRDKVYFVVSPSSPIGRKLVGKKVGDKILFNGKELEINCVS